MRFTKALIWGAGSLLAGCGGGGTTELSAEAPDPVGDQNEVPPDSTILGPICSSCVTTGGETSDFDGGQDPCSQFMRTVAVTDGDAEAAGYDVASARERLERSFEAPLRWTDLTTTSALPRATPMSGYEPGTIARGSLTTAGLKKTFFDTSTCTEELECTSELGGVTLDCRYQFDQWLSESSQENASYAIEVRLELTTDDAALDAVLEGTTGLEPYAAAASGADGLSLGLHADLASVVGTMSIEPAPHADRGSLDLYLAYRDDSVRGRLEVNFTNGWRQRPGSGLEPIDDRPLVAALQDDDCPVEVPPAPLAQANDLLGGQTPADALASLRALIAQASASATWTHLGAAMTFDVEIDSPEHACATHLRYDPETASHVGSKLVSLPVRLSSSDGLLDWSALATYELGDAAANLPHRLWFEQQLLPLSSSWHDAFPEFELAPHTDRIFLRFAARYPVAGAGSPPASAPASAVFEIFEQSSCPGNDPVCQQEQAENYAAACLVSPPGGACRPLDVLGRTVFF